MGNEKLVYTQLEKESEEYLLKYFTTPFRTGYVKCKGCVLPEYFKDFGDRIKEMDIRDDDIWVCTFPKTGKFFSFTCLRRYSFIVIITRNFNQNEIFFNEYRNHLDPRNGVVYRA